MYEDNEQPVLHRLLLIILWFVIIATIAWAVIWLAFFRHKTPVTPAITQQTTSQPPQTKPQTTKPKQTAVQNPSSSSNTNSATGSPSQSPSTTANSSSTTTTTPVTVQAPAALANTGAGDVFLPFAVATLVGSTFYYVRLRKRLEQ